MQYLRQPIFLRIFFLGLVSTMLLGCYEDAVSERLTLEFRRDGMVEITSVVELLPPSEFSSRAQRARVDDYRVELDAERDPWSRRFDALRLREERRSWLKQLGQLRRVERSGLLPAGWVQQFFADTGLTMTLIDGDGWRELTIYPASSTRATSQQRAEVVRSLDAWSRDIAAYLKALEKLYRRAEAEPQRAFTLVGSVLEEFLLEEQKQQLQPTTGEEDALIGEVRDAMERITAALVASDTKPYSLDELSSLVYDPFPAELTLRLPGVVLESEGFEPVGENENTVRIAPLRLWNALESLQTLWITPDPLVAYVNAARVEQEPIDLSSFLSRERRVIAVPSAATVRAAMEQRLVRPGVYRLRWSL